MQSVVRGFLVRKRIGWIRQIHLRRAQVKEKEKAMAEQLTFAEHVLLRAFRDKTLFLELDNLRYAESAAQMLRNNHLRDPYELARAAAAVFAVVDIDESGQLDVGELRSTLARLGITEESLSDHDLTALVEYFDTDKSGTIDLDEFQTLIKVLCCGRKSVEDNIKDVTGSCHSQLHLVAKTPPEHVVTELKTEDMTQEQLDNTLHALQSRVTNRKAFDRARRLEAEADADTLARAAREKLVLQRQRLLLQHEAIRRNIEAQQLQSQAQLDREQGKFT